MKKNPKQPSQTSPRDAARPFFARLLESQELERVSGGMPAQTMKAPSDSDECFQPPTTKKYPSDEDIINVTLKFPSDGEDVR